MFCIFFCSQHLDVWFDLMWSVRPTNADWTLAGSYFATSIKEGKMSGHYSNGGDYPVHWRDVEKVSSQRIVLQYTTVIAKRGICSFVCLY